MLQSSQRSSFQPVRPYVILINIMTFDPGHGTKLVCNTLRYWFLINVPSTLFCSYSKLFKYLDRVLKHDSNKCLKVPTLLT